MTADRFKPLSRAAAIALLFLPFLVAYQIVYRPLADAYQASREDAEELAGRLAAEQRAADLLPQRRTALSELARDDGPAAGGFLTDANETLATATLIDRIDKAAAAAGAQIDSTEILPARRSGGFQQIRVHVSLHATLPGFQALTYALESERPVLLLDDIDLRTLASQGVPSRTADSTDLNADFDVYGYLRKTPS